MRKTTIKHKEHLIKDIDGDKTLYSLGCLTQIVEELDERLTKLEKKK